MTDVERWQRVEAIFHEVADLAAGAARDARVVDLSDGDETMVAELRGLLAQDAELRVPSPATDPHLGLRLGAYRIDALVARGGMAAVYAAVRADETFQQRVAIKIMDLRLSDPALVTQFAAERQILATLEHPALTRLLDGGVTALGEPYLVMEFVDGMPIDHYCDQHRLALAARLRLFAQVCEGVSFAHRNLVLHRDLKPSNILVTADGHVKVVDFGTATLLQPDRLSTMSAAPLTPAYASPEQLTGRPIGTASDQYSLGLVIYELVAGASAFPRDASLMASMERALTGTGPTLPHTIVTAEAAAARQVSLPRLRRHLSGDLGTIVRKALSADPAARYSSVQHLADDLTRWAGGDPILGRAPSVAYRATRFVQRHAIATAVVAVLLVGLVATTVASLRQAARAREQAAIATTETTKARQLNRFMTQMLSSANPSWYNPTGATAGSITVREVLDGAGALIAAELGRSPDVEAEMRRTLGRTFIGMADPDRARPHLERALELFVQQGDRFGTAFTQALLGEHDILKGDYPSAETRLRASLAYVRSLGDVATDPDLHMMATNDLAVAINGLRPGTAEGEALKREAIAVADRSPATAGASALGRSNLSVDLVAAGDLDGALALLREALARMDALPPTWPERGYLFNNMCSVLRLRGEALEAELFGARASTAAAEVWGRDNHRWAAMTANWGRALVETGELERGRSSLEDAADVFRRVRPPDHVDLLGTLVGLGTVDRLQGRLAASEQVLQRARAISRLHPAQRDRAADVAGELGLTLRAGGRADEARRLLIESHRTFEALYGPNHPSTRRALARLDGNADDPAP